MMRSFAYIVENIMIHRHDWVNFQIQQGLKKALQKRRNTSSYPRPCTADT